MSAVASILRPSDLKELNKVSNYVAKNAKVVTGVKNDFTDASKLRLFWDSKVPKNDKTFYNFVSLLSATNSTDVLKEADVYQKFYDQLNKFIINFKQKRDTDCKEHHKTLSELDKLFDDLITKAKVGKDATSSSAVYNLHRSFIQKEEEIESMIKRMELIVVTEGWNKSLQAVQTLQADIDNWKKDILKQFAEQKKEFMEKQEQMQNQNEELVEKNKELQQQGKKLLKKNEESQEKQKKLLESVEQLKNEHQEALSESNKQRQEQQEKLMETIERMKKEHQESLLESDKQRKEQQEKLMKSMEQMKMEQQEKFMESIEQMKMEHQKASLKNDVEILQQRQELLECVKQLRQKQDTLLEENAAIKSKLESMPSQPESNEERKRYFIS